MGALRGVCTAERVGSTQHKHLEEELLQQMFGHHRDDPDTVIRMMLKATGFDSLSECTCLRYFFWTCTWGLVVTLWGLPTVASGEAYPGATSHSRGCR